MGERYTCGPQVCCACTYTLAHTGAVSLLPVREAPTPAGRASPLRIGSPVGARHLQLRGARAHLRGQSSSATFSLENDEEKRAKGCKQGLQSLRPRWHLKRFCCGFSCPRGDLAWGRGGTISVHRYVWLSRGPGRVLWPVAEPVSTQRALLQLGPRNTQVSQVD